eukprot:2292692-Amphidinium_carterae.1
MEAKPRCLYPWLPRTCKVEGGPGNLIIHGSFQVLLQAIRRRKGGLVVLTQIPTVVSPLAFVSGLHVSERHASPSKIRRLQHL